MRSSFLWIAVLAMLAIWFWQTKTLRTAPDVSFKTITNKDIKLSDLKGQPVIINFWATDCPGCIKEIPHLVDLYQQYHNQGLEIIAVSMFYDPPSHVVAMTKAKQLPYDVALDLKSEHSKAFGDVRVIPMTFLISPEGKIVMQKAGVFDPDSMKQKIEEMLSKASEAATVR